MMSVPIIFEGGNTCKRPKTPAPLTGIALILKKEQQGLCPAGLPAPTRTILLMIDNWRLRVKEVEKVEESFSYDLITTSVYYE
jgi:hypothetical protein